MKKLLFILPVFFFSFAVNAQQTEDDIYVGKGKTFGNYKGSGISTINPKSLPQGDRNTKSIKSSSTLAGAVVKLGWCEEDCVTIWVKKTMEQQ